MYEYPQPFTKGVCAMEVTSVFLACRMGSWSLKYPIPNHCCLPPLLPPTQTTVFICLYLLLIYWDDLPGDWRAGLTRCTFI